MGYNFKLTGTNAVREWQPRRVCVPVTGGDVLSALLCDLPKVLYCYARTYCLISGTRVAATIVSASEFSLKVY